MPAGELETDDAQDQPDQQQAANDRQCFRAGGDSDQTVPTAPIPTQTA